MNLNTQANKSEQLDLKEILGLYTRHWKWFVICVIITIGMAFAYIRYSTPEYAADAKIQILQHANASSEHS